MLLEVMRLTLMLDRHNIPYQLDSGCGITRVKYPNVNKCVCTAAQGNGTYGNLDNLIEISGLLTPEERKWDSVVGWLNADEVFNRISRHYERKKVSKDG